MAKTISKDTYLECGGELIEVYKSEDGFYLEIMQGIYHQMNNMLSHHCKLFVFRFDQHLFEHTDDNIIISKLFRKLLKKLKREYNFTRIAYIWVREQKNSDVQHYHCALILDGNKIQHSQKIVDILFEITECWNMPRSWIPNNPFNRFDRNKGVEYYSSLYRLSYLSKVCTKDKRAKTTNDYYTSQVKHKINNTKAFKFTSKTYNREQALQEN